MDERYLTSFEDQTSALEYTNGDTTLVSPQVSLVGSDEVVYSKKIPHESRIRFAKDETTGRLYFVIDGVYCDITELVKKSIPVPSEGYGEVDLGLPNGTIWADRNVGAETPQDNGAFFSWGNTDGVISDGTTISMLAKDALYKYAETVGIPESQVEEIMSQEGWEEMLKPLLSGISFIKGTTFDSTTYATTSGGTYTGSTLDAEHDAATINMGSVWRMPTSAETLELVQSTDHYYIGEDGSVVAGPFNYNTNSSDKELDGSKLRSICFVKSGETFNTDIYQNQDDLEIKYFIEFPFAGYCSGSLLGDEGSYGVVWSSSVCEDGAQSARFLYFYSYGNLLGDGSLSRYYGQSVRGVRALA